MLILFDGVCNLCHAWVRFVAPKDKRAKFQFASLQSESAQRVLSQLNVPEDLRKPPYSSVLLVDGDQILVKSSAVLKILSGLGGVYALIAVLGRIFPGGLRDWVYDQVAARRYHWFGQAQGVCPWGDLPKNLGSEVQKRFLP